ncbi:MAG: ABC transporter ATP-binding protein [Candidatus Dormibacteraceae bacterium]
MVVVTALGALGALGAQTVIPLVIAAIIDGPVRHDRPGQLPGYALLLIALGLVEFALTYLRRNYSGVASFRMETDIRNDFYAHLQSLQVSFHDNWQSGQLLSRAVADINTIRRFVGFGMVYTLYMVAMYVVVLAMIFRLDLWLGIITALSSVPVIWFSRSFFHEYRVISRHVQDQIGDLTTVVEEAATGVRIIKAFGHGGRMIARFMREAEGLRDHNLSAVRVRARLWTLLTLVPSFNLALVLMLGGVAVVHGALSIGGLVALISFLYMLVWPLEDLGWILSMGQEAETAADRLVEVFESRPEIADRPHAHVLSSSRGRVAFAGAGFRYPSSQEWILRGVDLEIEPGETLAVVGRTGSGKTTLSSLVARLYDVTEGAITLDGHDLRDLTLGSLRAQIGFAFEDPILFSASVHENLVMGRPVVSDRELKSAIEVAQADFVWDLPWGLETRVGEQGYTLSGGQRQRLALARAVLGTPRVLILDDPLSSVDVHTEATIEAALESVLGGVTAILVVHRPSTLALADRVALLEGGAIAAVGTHSELLRSNRLYSDLLSAEVEEAAS